MCLNVFSSGLVLFFSLGGRKVSEWEDSRREGGLGEYKYR